MGGTGQGGGQSPRHWLGLGGRHKKWTATRRALGDWTHKSSNGSSIPGGHSRKGDHQEDDDGTDTTEEVLGGRGSGCSVKGKFEGRSSPLKFSRLVSACASSPKSLRQYMNHLERKRERGSSLCPGKEYRVTRTGGQGPGVGLTQAQLLRPRGTAGAGAGPLVSGRADLKDVPPHCQGLGSCESLWAKAVFECRAQLGVKPCWGWGPDLTLSPGKEEKLGGERKPPSPEEKKGTRMGSGRQGPSPDRASSADQSTGSTGWRRGTGRQV